MNAIGWEQAMFLLVWSIVLFRIGVAVGRRSGERDLSAPPPPSFRMDSLPPATKAEIDAALQANRKIEAIRMLREATGMRLKESKEAVEAMERAKP